MNAGIRSFLLGVCPRVLRPCWERIAASDVGLRTARGACWSIAGAVVSRGLMLLASILVARLLGQTGFGEFGMIRSTVGMFVVFAGFGLGMTATKHIAEYFRQDPGKAGRIWAISELFTLAAGTVAAAAVLVAAPWLAGETLNAPHLAPEVRIGALILLVNAVNGAQTGALSGFEAFRTVAKINVWVGLASFPLLVGGAYWGGVRGAVWALLLNMLLNWLLNHLALRRLAARHAVPFAVRECARELPILWRFSLPAALSGFMVSPVLWGCNALLVQSPGGYGEMAIFEAANQWRIAALFLPGMVGQVMLPILSSLSGGDVLAKHWQAVKYHMLLNAVLVLLAAAVIALAAAWIMRGYGEGFAQGRWVLIVLAVSAIPVAVSQVVGQAMASLGKMWAAFAINLLWAVTLLGSSVWLLSRGYGALGLAVSYLLAYLLHSLWVGLYVWRFAAR